MANKAETWIVKQTDDRKTKESTRKREGNNWVGFYNFFPSEGNRKKSKNPTWKLFNNPDSLKLKYLLPDQ